MTIAHLEVLVEERSTEEALSILLPRLLGATTFSLHPYTGKADLLTKLPSRLRGYGKWMPADMRILIVVDRDDDDCRKLRANVDAIARKEGLTVRAKKKSAYQVASRIAIEELEAWFFGDWQAVRAAYPRVPTSIPTQRQYRDPDAIKGGTWEALERVLQNAGELGGRLRKIETARRVSTHMDPARNKSPSFQAFCRVVHECAS